MAKDRVSIKRWIELFDSGAFDAPDIKTQITAGWYDWFCKDKTLVNRTRRLAPKVKRLARSPKIDAEKTYVFFKNCCPVRGKLYDRFSICDLETGDVIYAVTPSSGFDDGFGSSEVWGKENGFDEPIVTGKWVEVRKFFGV